MDQVQVCDTCRFHDVEWSKAPCENCGGDPPDCWQADTEDEDTASQLVLLKAELVRVTGQRDAANQNLDASIQRTDELKEVCAAWKQHHHYDWKERAEKAEASLAAEHARAEKVAQALEEIDKQGPMERYGANVPSRLVEWVMVVRAEAAEALAEYRKGGE